MAAMQCSHTPSPELALRRSGMEHRPTLGGSDRTCGLDIPSSSNGTGLGRDKRRPATVIAGRCVCVTTGLLRRSCAPASGTRALPLSSRSRTDRLSTRSVDPTAPVSTAHRSTGSARVAAGAVGDPDGATGGPGRPRQLRPHRVDRGAVTWMRCRVPWPRWWRRCRAWGCCPGWTWGRPPQRSDDRIRLRKALRYGAVMVRWRPRGPRARCTRWARRGSPHRRAPLGRTQVRRGIRTPPPRTRRARSAPPWSTSRRRW